MLLRLNYLPLVMALAGALFSGCESKPATSQPVAAPGPAAVLGTAATVALASHDSLGTAAPAGPDVAALHIPFTDVKTIIPGLQLIISSVPVADTAVVKEPSYLKLVLTIKRHQQVIFRDTTADGLAYTEYSEPTTAQVYPIWIPTGPGAGELLVAYNNRPSRDRARRFFIRGNQVVKVDTLPTFDAPSKDWDKDGKPEYVGLSDYGEEWGEEGGPHWQTYNPKLYYEVRPTGLMLDSALTRHKALAQYGVFQGYEYGTKPAVLVK